MNLESIEDEIHSWIDSVSGSMWKPVWDYMLYSARGSVWASVMDSAGDYVEDSVQNGLQEHIREERAGK